MQLIERILTCYGWEGAALAGVLLLLLGAVSLTLLARSGMVDYFPFPGGPRLDDLALWRR